jgi:hypothetical protein
MVSPGLAEPKQDFITADIHFADADQAAFDTMHPAARIAFVENRLHRKILATRLADIQQCQLLVRQHAPFRFSARLAAKTVSRRRAIGSNAHRVAFQTL